MTSFDEIGKTLLRNKLLGRWAAEKLGRDADDAKAYADALAANAIADGDVFSALRRDFEAAGLPVSDQEISETVDRCAVQAGNQLSVATGGASDAAALALMRNITSR